jgi:cytochrome c peroxidase
VTGYMRGLALILFYLMMERWGFARGTDSQAFSLSEQCPDAFSKRQDGLCHLKSTYYPQGEAGAAWKTLPFVSEYSKGISPKSIALGRLLFFDPLLSGDQTQSCADCHQPEKGFGDGRSVSLGAGRLPLSRSAPSLWNVGFLRNFFWDGRAKSLEEQAQGPLFSPQEMAHTPVGLTESLASNPTYARLFREAFPSATSGIQVSHVTQALADFERTLISLESPYDRYIRGDSTALSAPEVDGFNVYRSFVSRCAECHTPPLFTNGQFAVIGVPQQGAQVPDQGVGGRLGEASLIGAFKVPSLRNIAKTAPYMHAGNFQSLAEVLAFYNRGGGRAEKDQGISIHWHIRPMGLTETELQSLALFLGTLSDESKMPEIPVKVPSGLPVQYSQKSIADGKRGSDL